MSDCNGMGLLEPGWPCSCSTEERKLETMPKVSIERKHMPTNQRDPKWWAIVGLFNLVLIEIAACVYFHAGEETSSTIVALVTAVVVFVLTITDFLTIFLAVAD
jgi:hypothetical protein